MLIVADTETTGVCKEAKMVEFGYIELTGDMQPITAFESLVDPECHIPFGASGVHHILDKHVENSPTAEELFDIVLKDVEFDDVWFIAHNSPFDKRFLSPHMNIVQEICTLRLAKRFYPDADTHKLMSLAYELDLDIPHGEAHRALYDCKVTLELLKRIIKDSGMSLEELAEMLNKPQKITKISFGKHKGAKLEDIPSGYVKWLLGQDNVDPDLKWSLEQVGK